MAGLFKRKAKETRSPPLLLIMAQGTRIRHIVAPAWVAAVIWRLITPLLIINLTVAGYLFFRNDLVLIVGAASSDKYQAYENEISSLHAEIARLKKIRSGNTALVEQKIEDLKARHSQLTLRQDRLMPLISGGENKRKTPNAQSGVPLHIPLPTPRPERVDLNQESKGAIKDMLTRLEESMENWSLRTRPKRGTTDKAAPARTFLAGPMPMRTSATTDPVTTLAYMENEQDEHLNKIASQTYFMLETIEEQLEKTGIGFVSPGSIGGPLQEGFDTPDFETRLMDVDEALVRLDTLKATARRIPLMAPLPAAKVTSRFGSRKDPLLDRIAYHSGLDFRAKKGEFVRATGAGRVVSAGWAGGYGRMIEIDHGHGVTTRYAHLQEILVAKGDYVTPSSMIGQTGNSGRSTGPHLHYEIRVNGLAMNPAKFISAGNLIAKLL